MKPTAHDLYYTQPDSGAVHITYEIIRRLGWECQYDDFAPTLHERAVESIASESDGWNCKFCSESVGWHYFQTGDTDACNWAGDFWSLNEDSSEVACDDCYDKVTAEPDYEVEPALEYTPQERAVMTFFDDLFRLFEK